MLDEVDATVTGSTLLGPGTLYRLMRELRHVGFIEHAEEELRQVALLSALIFGIVPGLQASRTDASGALHEGDRGSFAGRRHARTRVLVVGEVALTLVLLVTAGLLVNSFVRLQRVDPGFAVDQSTDCASRRMICSS